MTVNSNGLGRLLKKQAQETTHLGLSTPPTSAAVSSYDATTGEIMVTIPAFDNGVAEFGPLLGQPPSGVTPSIGDAVLVVSDTDGALWTISWGGPQ